MSDENKPFVATFSVTTLLEATQGRWLGKNPPPDSLRVAVSTDSRTIGQGQWFLPLSGENFNGHNFLHQAFQQGAEGAFVSESEWQKNQSEWQPLNNLIAVTNPLEAYLAIARWHRLHSNPKLKVIALTGSSGKTTVKEMLYAALSGVKKTQKTLKNFNNEVGVSQTLLVIEPDTELAIVEMGMRGLHEIDILSKAALPDIALVNNVGPAHIERLGSLENIAQAKLEIVEGLNPETSILVTNGNDALLNQRTPEFWHPANPSHQWQTFNLNDASQMNAIDSGGVSFNYQGHQVELPVPGIHNVQNALGVLRVGEILDIPLESMINGLAHFQAEGGRWNKQPIEGKNNLWVINDAYNANPDSCKASLKTLFEMQTASIKRILVLGGMKELGNFSKDYHQALGKWLIQQQKSALSPNSDGHSTSKKAYSIDILIGVGEEMSELCQDFARETGCKTYYVATGTDLPELIQSQSLPLANALYVLKGSRAYQLETVIQALQKSESTLLA